MNKIHKIALLVWGLGGICVGFVTSCHTTQPNINNETTIKTIKRDSADIIYIKQLEERISILKDSINKTNDSLSFYKHKTIVYKDSLYYYKDSVGNRLDVALFKLERVRYYNKVAGRRNNIIFLRGWLNRVLDK